jgi:mRNA interferase MazF
MLSRAQTTIVLPISEETLSRRGLPFLVPVPKGEGGLTKDSHILAHQIRIVDESRIVEKLGWVKPKTMREVDAALKFVLHLEQD